MEELYKANTIFALSFFSHLANTSAATQNLFFSPWSISSTMAMIYLGARGNTADQMAKVLQFNKGGDHKVAPDTQEIFTSCEFTQKIQRGTYPDAILQAQAADTIHSSFRSLSSAMNTSTGEYLLESANKLFGDKSARFRERYMQLSKKYYSTEPQAVDFLERAEDARKKINSWVKTQTKGKIPNLLPEGSIDAETKMVLVNAVYFKGNWKTPFQKKLNRLYPFRVNLSERKEVQMMFLHDKLNIGYIEDLKVQILELPYAGYVSMFLLLPDGIAECSTGLELLESEITYDKLNKWLSEDTMAEDDVEVYVPRFKLEEHYELKSILMSMGMDDAFSQGQANFLGMSEKNDLFLSEVFHQASVDVNEDGTEAAAGTGAIMSGRTGHGGPQFVADHPFLFFIMHKITKSILFFGRFASPYEYKYRSSLTSIFPMDSLAKSVNQFALELSKKLAESAEGKNIFFSPWGISTSLAMVYLGTKGTTAAQMSRVLQFSRDQDSKPCPDSFEKKREMEFDVGKAEEIRSNFQTLISEINNPSNACILKTANRIYGEKTYPFHNKYLQDMKTYFGSEPQSVNFMEASDQIRKEINSWVESQTEGKILNLLPDNAVDSATRMVLVNALYFKRIWEHQFLVQNTTEKPFRINKTTSKPVQMMSMKEKLQVFYIEKPQAIGLQLFYENRDLSLLILLPEDIGGLDQLEKAITYEKLSEWTSADMMELCDVQLHLPKFKLEETYDLKSTLSSMGMSDAFSQSKADFSGMSMERNLFLSNVFHKSFVEINEQGTEAAAGTGSEVSFRIKLPSVEFNADHPFLFFIRHNKTNSILFYGRFCSPKVSLQGPGSETRAQARGGLSRPGSEGGLRSGRAKRPAAAAALRFAGSAGVAGNPSLGGGSRTWMGGSFGESEWEDRRVSRKTVAPTASPPGVCMEPWIHFGMRVWDGGVEQGDDRHSRPPGENDAEYSRPSPLSLVLHLRIQPEADGKPSLMDDLCEANGTFAINLLKLLGEKDNLRNVFFSPLSLSSALTMVLMGAKGNTAAQMSQALCLNKGGDIHQGFQSLLMELNKSGPQYLLRTANRLFGEKTCDFLPAFKESCQKFYQADLEELNFSKDTEECRKHVNDWVTEKTEGKISEILGAGAIGPLTKLVLVNATYFKGKWDEQFDRKHTREMTFKTNKEKTTVQMMFKQAKLKMGYVEEVHAQVLELPYVEGVLGMLILLPDDNTDLAVVEKALTYEKFRAWTNPEKLTKDKVQVFLPRLKLEESYDLEAFLRSLGMTDAFEEAKADFSGMSAKKNVPMSKVVHKCFVEVNEEGTEAAAATVVVRNSRCSRTEPRFCADHPFLFFIRHHETNSILFCGKFSSP
ncbi:uncharacterized protein LOC116739053 [Phocoena sinus]|nr:uncharacterized protein LOC116739053 [Phocoena sinus]